MSQIWLTQNNISIQTMQESTQVSVDIPVVSDIEIQSIIKLAGELPGGLRIEGQKIIGSPFEVTRNTESRFVLRATALIDNEIIIEDRTLSITVEGPDDPTWITNEGLLPIGPSGSLFILDNEPVDFELTAIDPDIPAGDELEYFIKPGNGELPEGVVLTKGGRLVGKTTAILSLEKEDGTGHFDSNNYDSNAFDFGIRSANGFDSFSYDSGFFDDFERTRPPKKLNRYFEFIVTVTDGETTVDRNFTIFLVGDDFLRSDNTIMQVGTGVFTADNTYLRTPIWVTEPDLGKTRANNYVTLPLEVIDSNQLRGRLFFSIEETNAGTYRFSDGSTTKGYYEVSNIFPQHPTLGYTEISATNLEFNELYFIVTTGFSTNENNITDFTKVGASDNNYGTVFRASGPTTGIGKVYKIDFEVIEPETTSTLPNGVNLDSANGVIAGRVPYQPEVTQEFKFTIKATRYAADTELVEINATVFEDTRAGTHLVKINKLNRLLDDGVNDLIAFRGQDLTIGSENYKVVATEGNNPNYDLLHLDRNLKPLIPLTIFQQSVIGDYNFYINPLQQTQHAKLIGSQLIYSETEKYTITDFIPYIEWTIKNKNDTGFDVKLHGDLNEGAGLIERVKRQLADTYDSTLGVGATEVYLENSSTLRVRVPSTALSNNIFYVTNIFENSSELKLSITAQYDRVEIRQPLQRVFYETSIIGIGQYAGERFSKTIAVIDIDTQLQYSSPTVPEEPLVGQLWFNTGNAFYALNKLHEWDGTAWQPFNYTSINSPSATRTFDLTLLGEIDSQIEWISDTNIATIDANFLSTFSIKAESADPDAVLVYEVKTGSLPPGLELDLNGEIIGKVNQYGENYYRGTWVPGKVYNFNDVIDFNNTRYICLTNHTSNPVGLSEYSVENYVKDGYVSYDLELAFLGDNIYWKEYQFNVFGLTRFDNGDFSLDGNTTSIDRRYNFVATARDRFSVTTVEKDFFIEVTDPDQSLYSNVYVQAFLNQDKKDSLIQFIGDPTIFPPEKLYRPNDPNFGIQKNLRMLVYSGIEQQEIRNFVAAAGKNHKRSSYRFGEVKKAVANIPGTTNTVYEVVYVEIIDPRKPKNGFLSETLNIANGEKITVDSISYSVQDDGTKTGSGYPEIIVETRFGSASVSVTDVIQTILRDGTIISTSYEGTFAVTLQNGESVLVDINQTDSEPFRIRPRTTNTIKTDTDAIKVSQNKNYRRYISSIENMRNNIRRTGRTNGDFLPLWMRTAQNDIQALGYVTAIPICYCKPGEADSIILNIKNSEFNFNQFNFDVDRYIIDSTSGNSQEQYILFANYEFNI